MLVVSIIYTFCYQESKIVTQQPPKKIDRHPPQFALMMDKCSNALLTVPHELDSCTPQVNYMRIFPQYHAIVILIFAVVYDIQISYSNPRGVSPFRVASSLSLIQKPPESKDPPQSIFPPDLTLEYESPVFIGKGTIILVYCYFHYHVIIIIIIIH